MKNIITILFLVFATLNVVIGQNLPNASTATTAVSLEPLPNDYQTTDLGGKFNFKRVYKPIVPINNAGSIGMSSSVLDVSVGTQYFDGLNRPIQSVKKGHGYRKDFVDITFYDEFGRADRKYLPYRHPNSNSVKGKFKYSAFSDQDNFYNTQVFPGMGNYSAELPRYTKVERDALNRVIKTSAPGNNFTGSNRGIEREYLTNISSQQVRILELNSAGMPIVNGFYQNEMLQVSKIVDEDGGEVISYSDNAGQTILEQVKSNDIGSVTTYENTYFVYDDFGRLRLMIPPLATQQLDNLSWVANQTLLDELCFQYKYDSEGRIKEKKVPGKDWEYSVYDQRGRMVLYQDGFLRNQNKWNFIYYDQLGRTLLSGLYTQAANRQALQDYFNGSTSTLTDNLLTAQSNYTAGLYHYPILPNSICDIHFKNYYDHYNHTDLNNPILDATSVAALPQTIAGAMTPALSNVTKGRLTGSEVKILKPTGSALADWKKTINFYDKNNNLLQVQRSSPLSNSVVDITSFLYDFRHKLLASVEDHHNPNPDVTSAQYNTSNIIKKHKYDENGAIVETKCNINGLGEMPISYNEYDALGRLSKKSFGGSTESQRYTYNLRGWLTAINPDWVNNPTPSMKNYFGEVISYDTGFDIPLYSGNISGVLWRGAEITKGQRAYGYEYDYMKRLKHAEFREREIVNSAWDGTNWHKNNIDFTVSNIEHDNNGNLLSLNRRGVDINHGKVDMDELSYSYKVINGVQTNKLDKVADIGSYPDHGNLHDFKDGANTNSDYNYDNNGNLIQDENKDITSIDYNHLNKPELITLTNGNTVRFVYDANGNKIQKITNDVTLNKVVTIDYVSGHIYKTVDDNNGIVAELSFIGHSEGRMRPALDDFANEIYTYDYFIKDHLKNVRAIVNAVPTVGVPSATHTFNYHATHESGNRPAEDEIFEDAEGNIVVRPASTDPSNTAAIALDGDDPERRIGTSLMLRVSPGDKFVVKTDAYYNTATLNDPIDPNELLQSIITALTNNNQGESAIEGMTMGDVINESFSNPSFLPAYDALSAANTDNAKPKAYINYLFFNDDFQFKAGRSGVIQVNTPNQWHELSTGLNNPLEIKESGYLYLFHSVGDLSKVYFDDLDITYYKGNLLQEDHYYPYGMVIDNLHHEAAGNETNNFLYNSMEAQKDEFKDGNGISYGLNYYDYGARMQDPQLGRWHNIDALSEKYITESPYNYVANNPIVNLDIDGNEFYNHHTLMYESNILMRELTIAQSFSFEGGQYAVDNIFDLALMVNFHTAMADYHKSKIPRGDDHINTYYTLFPDLYNDLNNLKDVAGKPIDIRLRYTDKEGPILSNGDQFYARTKFEETWGGTFNRTVIGVKDNMIDILIYSNGAHTSESLANEIGDIRMFAYDVLGKYFPLGAWIKLQKSKNPIREGNTYWSDPEGWGAKSRQFEEMWRLAEDEYHIHEYPSLNVPERNADGVNPYGPYGY